ncbi:MAG TPA: hypothetical protein VMX17_03540 [Candidatus Glassbacteria bacterium]|nr:hypothetical protein [Candidatus Glassbacteria bacterium]
MTTHYLPVVSNGFKMEYQFWKKECPVYCNNLLVSPFTTGWDKRRRDFSKSEGLTIYADSGGYQILTRHEKINALDVLRWQELIADIGFTLDIPPHYFSKDYNTEQFQRCMYQSNKSANLMYKFKVNDDMQLWGVIQGRTYGELEIWYKDLTRDHEYDGYCIVLSGNKSFNDFIEQMKFATTIKKRIHFLGNSDRLVALLLAKLSHLTGFDYTYDSSTFSIGERYGKYIDPITGKHIFLSKDEHKRDKIESLPCDCPICSKRSLRDLTRNPGLINLHNLFVINKFNETIDKLSDEQFISLLKNLVKNELHMKQIIELLEISKSNKNMVNYYELYGGT